MNVNIRHSIIDNFKDASSDEIKSSISAGIEMGEEITLPGLGVFFELLWQNASEDEQVFILTTIQEGLQK